jgi:hypothetical protein
MKDSYWADRRESAPMGVSKAKQDSLSFKEGPVPHKKSEGGSNKTWTKMLPEGARSREPLVIPNQAIELWDG